MASHPKHAIGTNGNGAAGGLTARKIEQLLAYHDGIAAALRTTLAVLRGDAIDHRQHRAPAVLAAAVQLDAARRANASPTKQRAPHGSLVSAIKARRQRTADMLAKFDTRTPRAPEPDDVRRLSVSIQHGFLKKVRGGYIRTAKAFEP